MPQSNDSRGCVQSAHLYISSSESPYTAVRWTAIRPEMETAFSADAAQNQYVYRLAIPLQL